MLLRLFLFAISLSGTADVDDLGVARDALSVSLEGPELLDDREATARLLVVFAWRESAFAADALGDHGRACGLLQLHDVARQGHSCDEVRADRRLALRLGLAWMRRMRDVCGSVKGGLAAFASGRCSGLPRVDALVASRCALAGGC